MNEKAAELLHYLNIEFLSENDATMATDWRKRIATHPLYRKNKKPLFRQ